MMSCNKEGAALDASIVSRHGLPPLSPYSAASRVSPDRLSTGRGLFPFPSYQQILPSPAALRVAVKMENSPWSTNLPKAPVKRPVPAKSSNLVFIRYT